MEYFVAKIYHIGKNGKTMNFHQEYNMNNCKTRLSIFAGVLIFALFVSVVPHAEAATKMPKFALKSVVDGNVVKSSSFAGKVLYITFFATWCPPCNEEVPVLVELQKRLAESGFSVIGFSVDQKGVDKVLNFVKNKNINYPVLMANLQTNMDFGGVYTIPASFLVNRSGNVVKSYIGYVEHSVLEKDINSLLN